MKHWRGILQRADDDWTASARGLDTLALKPKILSEQKPIFRLGYEGGLVCRRELRSEENYLKSFTPFVNKKTPEYLRQKRNASFEPNGIDDSFFTLGGERTEAGAIEEEEEYTEGEVGGGGVSDEERSEGPPLPFGFGYEGREEDEGYFDEMEPEEIAYIYKARMVETLSLEFQMADTLEEKQEIYDALKDELTKPGSHRISIEEFVATYGERPRASPRAQFFARSPQPGAGGLMRGGGGGR
jgi:hypothetical protein